ncbi:MAG: 16S rRNA (guanine(527)-N(7))-methyltransferase RsmG [Candidatus Nanopelagicales bacterium]|nr:16S rRNA (guanine(527)-N(7))-methyltransferase RsmG [Candidatus Nanopelagicales bacterium]
MPECDAPESTDLHWLPARQDLAEYASILTTVGLERGLIGPRETSRIWSRHLLNCAVVALDPANLVPDGSRVIDIGSGAGLPGVVWALVRPDLHITLVESKSRRCEFLIELVDALGLTERVTVRRARAEDLARQLRADVVTARAVASLDRLIDWAAPLMTGSGRLVALKGEGAQTELCSAGSRLASRGLVGRVVVVGDQWLPEPTRVVLVSREGNN